MVAAAAGAHDAEFDDVVRRLVVSGDIKEWKAREILRELRASEAGEADGSAAGKVILLGEHGVVYGRHALALPIDDAVHVTLAEAGGLEHELPDAYVARLLDELGVERRNWRIRVDSRLPLGKGLGSSAAIAVAAVLVTAVTARIAAASATVSPMSSAISASSAAAARDR